MSTTQNKELAYEKGLQSMETVDVGSQEECFSLNMGDAEVLI